MDPVQSLAKEGYMRFAPAAPPLSGTTPLTALITPKGAKLTVEWEAKGQIVDRVVP